MLIKLLPDQVTKFWKIISFAINESLPPVAIGTRNRLNNMLKEILARRAHVWFNMQKRDESFEISAVLVTHVYTDPMSEVKSLVIYCLYATAFNSDQTWAKGCETLRTFARSLGCHRVVGYTNSERVRQVIEANGGSTKYTFVSLEV